MTNLATFLELFIPTFFSMLLVLPIIMIFIYAVKELILQIKEQLNKKKELEMVEFKEKFFDQTTIR